MKEDPALYLALVHYPVLNRNGAIIASAVTNLDLHDLARLVCTYDVQSCYIVTPLADQQELSQRLIRHWCDGVGRELMTNRAEALRRLVLVDAVADAVAAIERRHGQTPLVWATSARPGEAALEPAAARVQLAECGRPALMLLGTGWGLAPAALAQADALIAPIAGRNGYNHLSVRCAAAILLDRFFNGRS